MTWQGARGRTERLTGSGTGGTDPWLRRLRAWSEITVSPFAHEAEGLNRVKWILPDHSPFRAWTHLQFRGRHGKWHEMHLLVLGPRRLHLVEQNYDSGTLFADDQTWHRDGRRATDSPLKLARLKAHRLPPSSVSPAIIDVDRRQSKAFQAPEVVWNANANANVDRVRLDVFAWARSRTAGSLVDRRPQTERRFAVGCGVTARSTAPQTCHRCPPPSAR